MDPLSITMITVILIFISLLIIGSIVNYYDNKAFDRMEAEWKNESALNAEFEDGLINPYDTSRVDYVRVMALVETVHKLHTYMVSVLFRDEDLIKDDRRFLQKVFNPLNRRIVNKAEARIKESTGIIEDLKRMVPRLNSFSNACLSKASEVRMDEFIKTIDSNKTIVEFANEVKELNIRIDNVVSGFAKLGRAEFRELKGRMVKWDWFYQSQ